MRAIPQNKKWQLYWYWANKAGDILCKLNWHDEMEKDRATSDEPQTWCRCCGKEYYWQDNKWKEPT